MNRHHATPAPTSAQFGQALPRHARANRRRPRREQPALTDARDRRCLALWCVFWALVLVLVFAWLQLAAPALRMAGELGGWPAAVTRNPAAGLPGGARQ